MSVSMWFNLVHRSSGPTWTSTWVRSRSAWASMCPWTRWCPTTCRGLTSAQVSTALRPFYFLVHPDLFGRHPEARRSNEQALKELRARLDQLHKDDGRLHHKKGAVTFYVRSRLTSENDDRLRSLRLDLDEMSEIEDAIRIILEQTGLPTSFLESVKKTRRKKNLSKSKSHVLNEDDVVMDEGDSSTSVSDEDCSLNDSLYAFLDSKVRLARSRLELCQPFRLELCRMEGELCRRLNLTNIQWESWETQHRRGALDAFSSLLDNHFEMIGDALKGRKLVFGPFSGVSLEGHMVLYAGEVRHNWLRAIESCREQQKMVELIVPKIEKALSMLLCDVSVVRRRNQPITHVDDYRERVRQVITSINDYLSEKHSFPSEWPESLADLELCVESASSPLMISPRGELIVPSTCPCFLLVSFITDNLSEARKRREESRQADVLEDQLRLQCINQLGLIQLDRDDSISSSKVSECLRRLLDQAPRLRHQMHGNHLVISQYYSVLTDGTMCIPWNWKDS